jgi:amino acid adenylation domain-containing protein
MTPDCDEHYLRLFRELAESGRSATRLVHLWTLTSDDHVPLSEDSAAAMLELGFQSLLGITRAQARLQPDARFDLWVISNGVFAVGDEAPWPSKSVLLGPSRVIPREHSTVRVKLVDLPQQRCSSTRRQPTEDHCWTELGTIDDFDTVVYRGDTRWAPRFEQIPISPSAVSLPADVRNVLITGGLGGIGHTLAEHLAARGCSLLLTGRREIAGAQTQEARLKQQRLQQLRDQGARVLYVPADVTDAAAMEDALAAGRREFGKLHGIVHCAGVPGGGLAQLRPRDAIEDVLGPKIRGTLVLEQLCREETELEFFFLCSSAISVLGGVGQIDYVAANAFLDAFAQHCAKAEAPLTTAIGWGTWQSVGMSAEASSVRGLHEERASQLSAGILPYEGVEIFDRLMNQRLPHVIVTPFPLESTDALGESLGEQESAEFPSGVASAPRPQLTTEHVAPESETQRVITTIWEEILGIRDVGIEDDFFELGGHSLLAAQLASRIRTAFGLDISLANVFERPTVEHLAALVEAEAPAAVSVSTIPTGPEGRASLSFAQERLWFLEQLEPNTDTFNEPHARRIRGPLRIDLLERAVNEIRRRHETLRTVFHQSEQGPLQVTAPWQSVPLELIELTDRSPDRRVDEARRLIDEAAELPFDLASGPPFRAQLYRLDADDHVLFINAHHIVFDEWSLGVFLRELANLYEALLRGDSPQLAELPIQYRDFAVWQRQQIDSDHFKRQLAYWRQQLAGVPYLDIPTDRPRPPRQSYRGGSVRFELDPVIADGIRRLARAENVTPFMVLLACFKVLLHRYSGQTDIAVGSPAANRTHTELEPLIGFFVNMIALRTHLGGDPTFRELLRRVRTTCVAAYEHQELSFERLVQELQPTRDLSRHPLFQVAFDLQAEPQEPIPGPLQLDLFPFRGETPKFDLVFRLRNTESGFSGVMVYKKDLFTAETVQRMLGSFKQILASVVTDADSRVWQVPLLTSTERERLLTQWNETARELPRTRCLHELFEDQARSHRLADAVVSEAGHLSYDEVEGSANRLANLLRRRGVGRNDHVGVWMQRSCHIVPTLLGILKAGAAYVPLSPQWPIDRVQRILKSLGARALFTDASLLSRVHEIAWSLPRLSDVVCPDVLEEVPRGEQLDEEQVRDLWDHVSERARDWVQAAGLVSSFTGRPFSEEEAEHYRSHVLRLVGESAGDDSSVLEIGCGSGLLMFALAPKVQRYIGLDPAPRTQERNERTKQRLQIAQLELCTAFAHEIDHLDDETIDVVLMASTVQFFPGPYYLRDVLRSTLRVLRPGGRLIIADVPDIRRRAELKSELERYAALHAGDPQIHTKTTLDDELYCSPDDFEALAATQDDVASVTVLGRDDCGLRNELRHRFDVVIHKCEIGGGIHACHPAEVRQLWTGWHLDQEPVTPCSNTTFVDDPAYVIFTSGSTGEPKGVTVSHRAVGNVIDWVNRTFGVGERDRVLMVSSLCFDLSVYDIFGPLAAGGSVYVATDSELADPERLVEALERGKISFWNSAPAVLQQVSPFLLNERNTQLRRIRLVFLSGDWIPLDLPNRARRAFPNAKIVALGGATEAAVWSNFFPVEEIAPHWTSIPYGTPIQNSRYHVLDDQLEPCPIGVAGDLYIGGTCLADYYANAPRLTAERFIPDPFSGGYGERLYRTGDRARYWSSGDIEFLGRRDQQVKIRGFRIELGEVESALWDHPGIADVAVVAQGDRFGRDRSLSAFCTEAAGFTLAEGDLRRFLRDRLPEHMIPTAFIKLDRLPLTGSGKVDRAELAGLQASAMRDSTAAAPPSDGLESDIADVWCDVLGLRSVGRDENFFDVGGHSLLAVDVFTRLKTICDVPLSVVDLFTYPTISSLADYVVRVASGATESSTEPATDVVQGKERLERLRRRST